jgi:hypothetical protein
MIRLSQLITRKNIQLHQKENQRSITITQNAARSFRFAGLASGVHQTYTEAE